MTPGEFRNAVEGWEEEKREQMMFQRLLTTAQIQVHVAKGKSLKPTDVVKFSWEQTATKAAGKIIQDPAEIEAFKKRALERKLKKK